MSLIISTITNHFFSKIKKNPAFNTCPNGNILAYKQPKLANRCHILLGSLLTASIEKPLGIEESPSA